MNNQHYAGFFVRLFANLIDQLIGAAIFFLLTLPIFTQTSLNSILNLTLSLVILLTYIGVILPIIYCYLISKFGGTPGKMLFGLKITNEKGGLISFKKAIFRTYIGHFTSFLFFGLGYFWIFKDKKRRGFHDLVTGSIVIINNATGVFLGISALIALLILNAILANNIGRQITKNLNFYKTVLTLK